MNYNVGDIVRVLAPGEFFWQEVKILDRRRTKGGTLTYRLDVSFQGISRPSWFTEDEFEPVEKDGGR